MRDEEEVVLVATVGRTYPYLKGKHEVCHGQNVDDSE